MGPAFNDLNLNQHAPLQSWEKLKYFMTKPKHRRGEGKIKQGLCLFRLHIKFIIYIYLTKFKKKTSKYSIDI